MFQAKLKVSSPGDHFEQEADRIAEQVMGTTASPLLHRQGVGAGAAMDHPGDEKETLHRNAEHVTDASGGLVAENFVQELGSGQALDQATRSFMETRFGHDFSGVRVHANAKAAASARSVSALAYTVRNDIAFAEGQYQPHTPRGRSLLAHELAHVLQQQSAGERVGAPTSGVTEIIQRDPDPAVEAARIAQLNSDYQAAIALPNWRRAAELLNAYNDPDIRTRIAGLTHDQRITLAVGALEGIPAFHSRITGEVLAQDAEAMRVAHLTVDYNSAVTAGNWAQAALILNGFNESDIRTKLSALSDANLVLMRAAAVAASLGRISLGVDIATNVRAITVAGGSAVNARAWLTAFQGLPAAQQEQVIARLGTPFDARATLGRLFAAIPPGELDGAFRDTVRRISDLLERQVVRDATGQTDAQMAQTQALYMDQQATALATAAAAASGGGPATATQIQQSHQQSVAAAALPTRNVNRWTALPNDTARNNFAARAAVDIATLVTHATAVAPELGITAGMIHFNPAAIDGAPDTRYAEVASGGGLNVGMDFIDAAHANPSYVLGTVVHELYGHPAFGSMGGSYTFAIFDLARPLATQALSPAQRAAPATRQDLLSYGYHGTEIYSELREHRYTTRAPAAAGVVQGDEPGADTLYHVHLIKDQFAPNLAKGFLRGLYARFRIDPRITPAALALFTSAVEQEFPGQNVLQ